MLEHIVSQPIDPSIWAPILGRWNQHAQGLEYVGPAEDENVLGVILSPHDLRAGYVSCTVRIGDTDPHDPVARVVLGYDAETAAFYSAGLGGFNHSYTVQEHAPGRGSIPLKLEGSPNSIERDREYEITIVIVGQSLSMSVDGVDVIETQLPHPLFGETIGLECWGISDIHFSEMEIGTEPPKLFAVMEFGGVYDVLYEEVIRPVAEEVGFVIVRADDVSGPGLILEDIRREIQGAYAVIAEITPPNRNVFYELGFAHASNKPAILLARRGDQLPFDVSGYRCIFYDDSIGGKVAVEEQLRRHLTAV